MANYERLEKIGEGSSGIVYKARDPVTREIIAIKEFVKGDLPRKELTFGRRITHPNVLPVYHHFELDNPNRTNCIAMEYAGGGNLQDLIDKGPLPIDKALSIVKQILNGIEAAHRKGIIHLDLKPENVLLTSDGTVKIADFGHARAIDAKTTTQSFGMPAGTPGHMAPEQVRGEKCDARTDIYAIGVILHQLFNKNAPENIRAVIVRCMDGSPDNRYASASELRDALNISERRSRFAGVLTVSVLGLALAAVPVWSHFARTAPRAVTAPPRNLQPADALSEGRSFLDRGLPEDALRLFDSGAAVNSKYPGIQYYRGLALENLNRLDDAIDAFKQALPTSEPERRVLWSWDLPPTQAEHGIIRGMDNIQINWQRDFFEGRREGILQNGVIFGERNSKSTVLHFIDLKLHRERRFEISDDQVGLDTWARSNGLFTIVSATKRLYGFSADGTFLWSRELAEYGKNPPKMALIGDTFYVYSRELQRFDLLDAATSKLLWRKDGFSIETFEPPLVRRTKANGEILIVKSGQDYHAIRKSDGSEAWALHTESKKVSSLANDRLLIVFEPERRIFTVDLESGKTLSETNIEQFVDALPFPDIVDSKYLVGALLDGGTLYVMSKDLELYAINASPSGRGRCVAAGEGPKDAQILRPSPGAARRPLPEGEGSCVRWHTPIHKRMQAIRAHGRYVYLGTNDGELIVMDAVSGTMLNKAELTREPLLIDYAGDDAVLAGSNNTLYGLDPAGIKRWEYPSVDPLMEATYFNGTVTVYTSPVQMAALDVMTGKVLFQYIGDQKPYVFANDARFHFVDESGVKEYAVKQTPQAVTDMETLTELGRVYQAKGDLTRARVFIDKASEIDVNYPPVVLVRSRLLKAEGHTDTAGRELAKYVSLLGFDSKEGQSAISEMKRDYRLLWVAAIGPNVAGEPLILSSIGNRLVNVGRRVGHFADIVALDPETGAVVWSYRGERYLASVAEPPYVWYVSSSQADGTLLNLYRIDVRTGERQLMESKHNAARVDQAWIANESGHVRVLTTPPGETKPKRLPPPNVLWEPVAYLTQNGRLYAYTSDGRAYAMQLN